MYVINKVLLQHNGTIRKFVLDLYNVRGIGISNRPQSHDVDQLLLLVTQKGVEEIYISFLLNGYKLPNCIFSCLALKRLHLYAVIVDEINFPPNRHIFPNVLSICFECVEFVPTNLQDYTLNIPQLETLSFLNCRNICHFNIITPKLCSLTFKSSSSDVHGKFLPINLDLRSICTLDLEGPLRKIVEEFARMEFPQLNVEYLKLSCYPSSAFVHLLRQCPKLCKLHIDLLPMPKNEEAMSELLSNLHANQTNEMIHALKLDSFRGLRCEILFIKALLANFLALEKVVVIRHHQRLFLTYDEVTIIQELLHFPRASTKAEIILV
nr:F-box/FBD/LRR-repeat protein At1g13570-like [Ipomoea batatas]